MTDSLKFLVENVRVDLRLGFVNKSAIDKEDLSLFASFDVDIPPNDKIYKYLLKKFKLIHPSYSFPSFAKSFELSDINDFINIIQELTAKEVIQKHLLYLLNPVGYAISFHSFDERLKKVTLDNLLDEVKKQMQKARSIGNRKSFVVHFGAILIEREFSYVDKNEIGIHFLHCVTDVKEVDLF